MLRTVQVGAVRRAAVRAAGKARAGRPGRAAGAGGGAVTLLRVLSPDLGRAAVESRAGRAPVTWWTDR